MEQSEFYFYSDPGKKVRKTDPSTSQAAAFSNLPLKETQRRELLEIHVDHHINGKIRGLTNDELDQLTPINLNSSTTRVSELADGGWLKNSGLKRKTRTGNEAVVWEVTPKALFRLYK